MPIVNMFGEFNYLHH